MVAAEHEFSLLAGLAVSTIACAVTYWIYHRRQRGPGLPQCSIPEALHALAHGGPTTRRLASRALCSIVFGEVW